MLGNPWIEVRHVSRVTMLAVVLWREPYRQGTQLSCLVPPQATSCSALEMATSSEVLHAILEYVYTDESHTIKGNFSRFMLIQ